jgi:ABC-type multidrug transport system fused ATPase/permease subunit
MALLLRFYAASAGTITIDGHAIDQLDPSWLRVCVRERTHHGLTVA